MMDTDALELLARVKPMDPPPFLFTRIAARLDAQRALVAPRSWITAAIALAALMLVLNVLAVRNASHRQGDGTTQRMLSDLGVNTTNQLYQ